MKRKPRGRKYRNLIPRGSVIYYERRVGERRVCFSTRTDDWDVAAEVKAEYERQGGVEDVPDVMRSAPTFQGFAPRYLKEATAHLAETTKDDRTRLLDEEGHLVAHFGRMRLDEIGRRELTEWWGQEVESKGRSVKTGKNYLDALSAVFRYAEELEILEENPTDALRRSLSRRRATKRGRAEADPSKNIKPIEGTADMAAFTKASRKIGGVGHVCDVLLLDAGLRLAEAQGLRWSDVWWGRDGDDVTRALVVSETVARGKHVGTTKSGRERRVALSRRLRAILMERWMAAGRPQGPERVLVEFDPANYRNRHFTAVCKAAGLTGPKPHEKRLHSPKDLRDTFASQLLTSGVQLGYVSAQLGHADVAVTARHYAKWVGGDVYREPITLAAGEVPADIIKRLEASATPVSLPTPSDGAGL